MRIAGNENRGTRVNRRRTLQPGDPRNEDLQTDSDQNEAAEDRCPGGQFHAQQPAQRQTGEADAEGDGADDH